MNIVKRLSKFAIISSAIVFSLAMLMAGKPATAVFKVQPEMHCQNCENTIKSELRWEKGVKKIETSLSNQTVTVQYDPAKTTPSKIAEGFEKLGYEATPADSVAEPEQK